MRRLVYGCCVLAVTALACAKKESATTDSSANRAKMTDSAMGATASKIGETGGMKTPESVRYDPDLDVFYVSNIDGNPSMKDGKGEIVVVRADSTGVMKTLVDGGQNGATLNAPKGLALVGDTLWVADIDAVRAFNRKTGAPIASIDLRAQKATFLNDVTVGPGGAIYITDTGIAFDAKGNTSHPGVNRIFKLEGRKITEAAKGDSLASPNGITWDASGNRFLLAPFGGPAVQAWKESDAAPSTIASGPGQYDGIEVLSDGRILVTSWADSAVHVIHDGMMMKLVPNVSAPADIGVDTKRQVLAIPRFQDNKVEYYKIP